MTTRTIHAILAGINTYQYPVKPLEGCLYDVSLWKEYLDKESSSFNLRVTVLENEQVTKKKLSTALQEALVNATSADVVFLFFSGHGTRETASPVFASIEQDNALECLVCYDSILNQDGNNLFNLLADKELHYIISKYANEGTHIVFVFDCCHAGGMTRNAFAADSSGVCSVRRHTFRDDESFMAPLRSWNNFLFGEDFSFEQLETDGWMNLIKQKPHITISACQNDESAYEQNGRGVFTANMIDVLNRCGGVISYYNLQSCVRLFTQNQFRQTPEVYAVRLHEEDLLRTFLDKTIQHSEMGCTVLYKKFAGWIVDLGAVHGITSYSGPLLLKVSNNEIKIREVYSTYSRLDIPAALESSLVRQEGYVAVIKNHYSGNTLFFLDGENQATALFENVSAGARKWILENNVPFSLTDNRIHAAYLLSVSDGKIFISQNDGISRPVTQIRMAEADVVSRTIQYMRHIAQWEYIRTLCNPEFLATNYPVAMTFYRCDSNQQKHILISRSDTFEFDYEKTSSGEWSGLIKVSISNSSKIKYYCSILYLSNLFQIYGNILDGKMIGLNVGETGWINNGDTLEIELEKHVVDFNYPYSIFYLKLLAATTPFQIDTLEQSALPAPELKIDRGFRRTSRTDVKTRVETPENKVSWFTRTMCFKGRNPYYQNSFHKGMPNVKM